MSDVTTPREECAHCAGTGWRIEPQGNSVAPCECRSATRPERAFRAAQIPQRYHHCDFDNFDLRPGGPMAPDPSLVRAHRIVQDYALCWPQVSGKGLLLLGDTGVGKTHLIVALAKRLIQKGAQVLFIDYQELLRRIQASYSPGACIAESDIVQPVLYSEVMVIDDLGANRVSEWVEDTINYVLNYRYGEMRPTLLTANLKMQRMSGREGLRQTYPTCEERLGPRVASRLYEMCRILEIEAEDFRRPFPLQKV